MEWISPRIESNQAMERTRANARIAGSPLDFGAIYTKLFLDRLNKNLKDEEKLKQKLKVSAKFEKK